MAIAILTIGLLWWFGVTYFGIRKHIQQVARADGNAPASPILQLTGMPAPLLYAVAAGAILLSAYFAGAVATRLAEFEGVIGPNVLAAILASIVAGIALASARQSS